MKNKSSYVLNITNMWPSSSAPWLGTFVQSQVKSLEKENIHTKVINIRSKKSGGSNFNYIAGFFRIFSSSLNPKYQAIHIQHWICWVLCLPIFWKKKIYTVHEGEFFLGGARRFFIEQAIKYSDTIIFVNKQMFDSHQQKYPDKPIFFIPCGVDTSLFKKQPTEKAKDALGLNYDKSYLFFPASKLRLEKNAQLLKQWETDNKDESIEIIWGGNIDYSDIPLYMNASTAVLTLGNYESDGMVVKESLACGTPVISTDVGNSRLYIESEREGVIIDRNLQSLSEALRYVLESRRKTLDSPKLADTYQLADTAKQIKLAYQATFQL